MVQLMAVAPAVALILELFPESSLAVALAAGLVAALAVALVATRALPQAMGVTPVMAPAVALV